MAVPELPKNECLKLWENQNKRNKVLALAGF